MHIAWALVFLLALSVAITIGLIAVKGAHPWKENMTAQSIRYETPFIAKGDKETERLASHRVKVKDAMWDGSRWVVYGTEKEKDGELLTTNLTTAWYYPNAANKSKIVADLRTGQLPRNKCTEFVDEYTLVHNATSNNHWHVYHDNVMPVMDAMRQAGSDTVRLYQSFPNKSDPAKLANWGETLKYPDDIKAGTCFANIEFQGSSGLNAYTPYDSTRCSNLVAWRDDYLKRLSISDEPRHGGIKWIARKGSRQVLNRAEIIATLQKSGVSVQTIYLEDMDLKSQIQTFVDADVIIGPHGAGLGKVMFMQPNSTLIEIMPWGMGANAPALWKFPDGSTFRKGQNFANVGKCLGVNYVYFDAKESDMVNKKNKSKHYSSPKKNWGATVPLWKYTTGKSTIAHANNEYVGAKDTQMKLDTNQFIEIIKGII